MMNYTQYKVQSNKSYDEHIHSTTGEHMGKSTCRVCFKNKLAFKNKSWKHVTYILGEGRIGKCLFQLEEIL